MAVLLNIVGVALCACLEGTPVWRIEDYGFRFASERMARLPEPGKSSSYRAVFLLSLY